MEWEHLFADATAHELRTPIAELRTITEVAERMAEAFGLAFRPTLNTDHQTLRIRIAPKAEHEHSISETNIESKGGGP